MSIKLKPIKDQVIVVAGATSRIGQVTARTAAKRGARVFLIAPGEAELGEIVRGINNAGGRADYAVADVGDADALAAAARAAVARFGRVDSWIDDAAAMTGAPGGVVHRCQAAVTVLRDRGGALITVADAQAAIGAIESLRADLRERAPAVSVTLVRIGAPSGEGEAPGIDDRAIADAVLLAAVRPRREIVVGGARRTTGRLAGALSAATRRPGLVAAVGLGGLALAAGTFAALRRRGRRARD